MLKILVVDDEPWIRKGIISKIEQSDLDMKVIAEANDGGEAVGLISDTRPDIVISDIRMPEIDGLQLVKMLKERDPAIYFILISGYAEFEYARQAITMNVNTYLLKPIKQDELKEALLKAAGELGARRQMARDRTEQMLGRLIQGKMEAPDKEHLDRLLSGFRGKYFAVACIHADPGHKQAEGDSKRSAAVDACLNELIARYENLSFFGKYPPANEWFIFMRAAESELLSMHTGAMANDILSLLQKDLDLSITIAVSDTESSIEKLPGMVGQCRKLMDRRLMEGSDRIYYAKDALTENAAYPDNILKALRESIKTGDLENAAQLLYRLFLQREKANYDLQTFRAVFLHVITIIADYCFEHHMDVMRVLKPEALNGDILGEFENCEAMVGYLNKKIAMATEAENNLSNRSLLYRILSYVNEHLEVNITREDISRKFNITPNYFSRLFNGEMKISFSDYITENRINKAKELLECTSMNISEIAKIIGYSDVQYFWKVFKKHTGGTPQQYRQKHCRGI